MKYLKLFEDLDKIVIMDYEIEDFIKTLQDVVKEPGEEIE